MRDPFKDAMKAWEAMRTEMDGWLRTGETDGKRGRTRSRPAQASHDNPQITIRQVMTPDPISITPESPLHRALELLMHKDLSALPVLDERDGIVGLVNERHLLNALGDPAATIVSAVMDAEPVTVGADEAIVEVVDRLMTINVRQVLVLDGAQLVGVVTRADLMPAILEVFRERAKRISLVRH